MHVDQMLARWAALIWTRLGTEGIAALSAFAALYFVIKQAVKHGVKEAVCDMKEDDRDKETKA